jgi:fluoride exporter
MSLVIRDCVCVAIGGAIGSLARYGVGLASGAILGKWFPWGTLIVNVVGCLLMGIVVQKLLDLEAHSPDAITPAIRSHLAIWHRGVAIGFLGGLTTFSSFGADTIRELSSGQIRIAVANVVANVTLSLVAVWLGMSLMQAVD